MQSHSIAFSLGKGCLALSMHPEEYLHEKTANESFISHYTLLRACIKQLSK